MTGRPGGGGRPDPGGEGTYIPTPGTGDTMGPPVNSEVAQGWPFPPIAPVVKGHGLSPGGPRHVYQRAPGSGGTTVPDAPPNYDGSGGSGSGGSGGGSGGPTAAEVAAAVRLQRNKAEAAFREVLRRWGIPASKNLMNLIQKAIKLGWDSTLFVDHLRHTPDYHEKFPGMRYGTGMTEATYNAQYNSYREQAKLIGEELSRKTFARALKNGVTPEEFAGRAKAIDSIVKWAPMMEGFKETLAANGYVDKAANITQESLMKFAMGLGPVKWEALWQETVVGVNMERVAGITIGTPPKGWGKSPGGGSPLASDDHNFMHMTRDDMLTIINQVESTTPGFEVENVTGQQWRDIGARMRQFKGQYLAKYGITAKDLVEMELGGPRAAVIADKSQRIIKEQDAADQPRAVPMEAQQVGAPGSDYKDLPQSQ